MADLDREEFDEEMDRREFRRKRRVRNQVIAYVSAVIMLAVILIGAGLGIHRVIAAWNDKKQAEELQAQMEEMSAQEEQVAVEAPVETEEPVEEEQKSQLDEIVDACIAEMPLEDKVAGLFIITPEALTGTDVAIKAGDTTKEKLSQHAVGGLIYAKQNIKSADQLKEMISGTQGFSKYPR